MLRPGLTLGLIAAMACACLHDSSVLGQEPGYLNLDGSVIFPPGPDESSEISGNPSAVSGAGESEGDLETRLKELETAFQEYKEGVRVAEEAAIKKAEEDKKKKEEDEKKKAEEANSKPTFKLNGRLHADYWAFPETSPGIGFFEHSDPADPQFGQDPEDLFTFRRIRLEMSGDLPRDMFWRMQIDFNEPQNPEFKDVYIGIKNVFCDQSLVIGHQKRPIGLDALNSSRFNIFLERPEINEAFNEDARRLGLLVSGSNEDESLNWAYGVYNLENVQDDGEYRGDPYQLSANFRLHGSPWYENDGADWFHWGIAAMFANPDGNRRATSGNNNEGRFRTRPEGRSLTRWLDTGRIRGADFYETVGVEAMQNIGPFHWCSEYMVNWMQRDGVTPGTGPDLFFHGGYVQVAYFLTGEHMTYRRDVGQLDRVHPRHDFLFGNTCEDCCGHGWGAWQIAARYSFLDLSNRDITGGFEKALTVAVNWLWTPYAKLQFNVVHGTIDERGPIGGFDSGDYTIVGTRVAVDF